MLTCFSPDMILKERDTNRGEDAFQKAGTAAEAQMAFYLRRTFADKQHFFVINDLRIQHDGDAAQIDHLIVHSYGMVIVESKSVTDKLSINAHGEWVRWYNGQSTGMASPILQARRQGAFLRAYLNRHCEQLRDHIKLFGLVMGQGRFGAMPLDVLVSISDQGIIERPAHLSLPEVRKADQICLAIVEIMDRYHKANRLLSLDFQNSGYILADDELQRITRFLVSSHAPRATRPEQTNLPTVHSAPLTDPAAPRRTPLIVKAAQPAVLPVAPVAPTVADTAAACSKCSSHHLRIEYGKYGYYFKCSDCEGNQGIQSLCPGCKTKHRIRKEGLRFWAECSQCNSSEPFWTNPVG